MRGLEFMGQAKSNDLGYKLGYMKGWMMIYVIMKHDREDKPMPYAAYRDKQIAYRVYQRLQDEGTHYIYDLVDIADTVEIIWMNDEWLT